MEFLYIHGKHFLIYYLFEAGSHCASSAGLEFAIQTRLASSLQRFICLFLCALLYPSILKTFETFLELVLLLV